MLLILMFFREKIVADRFVNGELPPIEDESILALKRQNENRPDKDDIAKLRGILKRLVFTDYRFLLQNQEVPTLFYEYVMKFYSGGEEYEGYLDFMHNIIGSWEHQYRSNDLNFRVRMISHQKQIKTFIDTLMGRIYTGNNIKDPHQVLEVLRTLASPKGIAYTLVQDSMYCDIDDLIRNK